MVATQVLEFLEFVNRLPLTKDQKIKFVKMQIEIQKKHITELKRYKKYFSNQVLTCITDDLRDSYVC
jgi:hypothetical protein